MSASSAEEAEFHWGASGRRRGALSQLYSWGLPLPSQKWAVGQRETGQTPEGLGMGSDCPMDPDSAPSEGSRPEKALPMTVT